MTHPGPAQGALVPALPKGPEIQSVRLQTPDLAWHIAADIRFPLRRQVGAFGTCRDGMEVCGRAIVSKERQRVSPPTMISRTSRRPSASPSPRWRLS